MADTCCETKVRGLWFVNEVNTAMSKPLTSTARDASFEGIQKGSVYQLLLVGFKRQNGFWISRNLPRFLNFRTRQEGVKEELVVSSFGQEVAVVVYNAEEPSKSFYGIF